MKYIVRSLDGREYGPFTSDQLQELKDAQRLGPGDFIRRETGKTWSPFEKIPGLGDVEGGDATIRDDPPDAGPSGRPVPGESTDEPVLAATDPLVDDLRTDEPETPPVPTTGPSPSQIDLAIARASASADLLVQHGVLVSRLPGETDVFELQQSFLDVAKQSLLA
ncbi:MAG: GYF domain-containing protein, partial [Phycisphaerales bacterium]|nr:GYF domain-containing protein [Phycisphaerales bacterium]